MKSLCTHFDINSKWPDMSLLSNVKTDDTAKALISHIL